jgi:hypothetical protein
MNKYFLPRIYPVFSHRISWKKWKHRLTTTLKKFQRGSKKRFFIKYKYPHRKSLSKCKSFVTVRKYLLKDKLWYRSKKNCLRFYNFEKFFHNQDIIFDKLIMCHYEEENEFNKVF